jgi:23S rRNA (uridine2552-2'-O)-methyltransferase
VRERKREHYYKKAKEEDYRSRATYKLLQTSQKYDFLKEGDVVIDLGAAPGGWLQAARKIVGNEGFLLGVDLRSIQPIQGSNIHTFVGDITSPETLERIERVLPALADVVISDVSPNVSGVWEVDHARQISLARRSLLLARMFLKADGNFFVKAFQGSMFNDFYSEVKQHFVKVKIVKPKASRKRSAELFILGMRCLKRNVSP